MSKILIYQDYVHNNGSLFKVLCRHFGAEHVGFIDADAIISGQLTDATRIFFMPGGASRYVAAKLDGAGNARIKNYVAAGGIYFGICAGAYYACRNTIWRQGEKDEICVANELGFFPGDAIGPVVDFTQDGYLAKNIMLKISTGEHVAGLYWGGPLFRTEEQVNFEVLARYDGLPQKPPAVITGLIGKGSYVLSSPHLEIDSDQIEMMRFDVSDNRQHDIATLERGATISTDYFLTLLETLVEQ